MQINMSVLKRGYLEVSITCLKGFYIIRTVDEVAQIQTACKLIILILNRVILTSTVPCANNCVSIKRSSLEVNIMHVNCLN